ncbi:MAG: O-antigen ligase family protein [Solobacterium sp.]|nr:O-antigen ligase family protein [Solobacterium sp.]
MSEQNSKSGLNRILNGLVAERYNLYFYCAVYMLNHILEYYTGIYLRPLFLASYLWTLIIFIYHSFVTKKYITGTVYRWAYVFLMINMISTFMYRANWRFSVLQDFAILIQYIFVFYSAFLSSDTQKEHARVYQLIKWFNLLIVFVSAASVIAVLTDSPLISMQGKVAKTGRQRGFYNETNEGAYYAYTSIMFSAYLLYDKFKKQDHVRRYGILFLINLAVQCVMILLTGSRTLMLLMVMTVMYAVYLFIKNMHVPIPRRFKPLIASALIVLAYVLLFTKYGPNRNIYYYLQKYPDLFSGESRDLPKLLNKMTSGRYYLWKSSIEVWLKSPLLGYGLKSAGFTYEVYRGMSNSHNVIVNTLLFSGLAGMSALVMYVKSLLKIVRKNIDYRDAIIKHYVMGSCFVAMLEVALLYNGKALCAICWALTGYICLQDKNWDAADQQ